MARYAAFLRGINVGGHNKLRMEELRQAFGEWGFENVKTLLASGNVAFESSGSDAKSLARRIESKIQETFNLNVSVIVRSLEEIEDLVNSDPFKGVEITKQTRLYITFLGEDPQTSLTAPYQSPVGNFQILHVSDREVCSVLTVTSDRGTTDGMEILEKEFGKNITTRNWNTVTRLAKL